MVAGRYRIVGLIGRGGMGEVYRADDLELHQAVALKFLPLDFSDDPVLLARFRNEVRLARRVSHPNVCRVYDIGDLDGSYYISMEYVDGEDLRTLLRRIGRISQSKALEIARQACAGLAAAHKQGVLHRDLKPANIMIDGQGKVRITDFGLAALADEMEQSEIRSGTPTYMAPEQLDGKQVSHLSDIFSLGLVLHEIFTGRRVFEAGSLQELRQLHRRPPQGPGRFVSSLDPAIDDTVRQCLQRTPQLRPESALSVAASLPGGNALAEALEAGETPSPEVVAASGGSGRIPLRSALLWLMLSLLGLVLSALLGDLSITGRTPLQSSPEVLAHQAQQMIRHLGHDAEHADSAWGWTLKMPYLEFLTEFDPSPGRWDRLESGRPAALEFWYRQSPEPLASSQSFRVSYFDPPPLMPGMAAVRMDSLGRLIEMRVTPGQPPAASEDDDANRASWSDLFRFAGLDPAGFTRIRGPWTPPVFCDRQRRWEGAYAELPDAKVRIEGCSHLGKIVYFRIHEPWEDGENWAGFVFESQLVAAMLIAMLFLLPILIGSAALARRNMRSGRGDRPGAFAVATFVLATSAVSNLLLADHVGDIIAEFFVLTNILSFAVLASACTWILYMALEPYLRRRWPEGIVSWTRLLAGRFRDPLVGRDILIGASFGVMIALLGRSDVWLYRLLRSPAPWPTVVDLSILEGLPSAIGSLLSYIVVSVVAGLGFFFLLLLLRLVLRRDWIAITFLVGVGVVQNLLVLPGFELAAIASSLTVMAIWCAFAVLTLRYGVLAGISGLLVHVTLQVYPLSTQYSSFYFGNSLAAVAACLLLLGYGFFASLDRQAFDDALGLRGEG